MDDENKSLDNLAYDDLLSYACLVDPTYKVK